MRGGFGIFHSQVFSAVDAFETYNNLNGFRSVTFAPGDALFPQFPNSLPGPSMPPGVPTPPGVAFLDAADYAPSRRLSPESRNFTLGYERQVWGGLSASVDLSYNLGTQPHRPDRPERADLLRLLDRRCGGRRSRAMRRGPLACPAGRFPPACSTSCPTAIPYGGYRNLYLLEAAGESEYTALRFAFERRFANNFSLQGNYTWSRITNNGDDFRQGNSLPLNPNDREAEWVARRHRHPAFVLGERHLPAAVGFAGRVDCPRPLRRDGGSRVGQDLDGNRDTRERPAVNGVILERNSFRRPAYANARSQPGEAVHGRGDATGRTLRGLQPDEPAQRGRSEQRVGCQQTPLPLFMTATSASPPRRFQVSFRVTF